MITPINGIKNTASRVYHQVLNVPYPPTDDEKLIGSIRMALSDWQRAEIMFHEVTDPDLIDHAIYDILSAKTKYAYLMKTARKKNLHW